jgi:hypothetical protein
MPLNDLGEYLAHLLTDPSSFHFIVWSGLAAKKADDSMPFTSILYANGPGYVHVNGTRANITLVDYCKQTKPNVFQM